MAYLGGESKGRALQTPELIAYHPKIRGEGILAGLQEMLSPRTRSLQNSLIG